MEGTDDARRTVKYKDWMKSRQAQRLQRDFAPRIQSSLDPSFALSRMSVPGDSVVAPGGGAHAW